MRKRPGIDKMARPSEVKRPKPTEDATRVANPEKRRR